MTIPIQWSRHCSHSWKWIHPWLISSIALLALRGSETLRVLRGRRYRVIWTIPGARTKERGRKNEDTHFFLMKVDHAHLPVFRETLKSLSGKSWLWVSRFSHNLWPALVPCAPSALRRR